MSITHINFDFAFYFCMVALVSLWNCGVMAITREGKIFHFVLRFFDRKKEVETLLAEAASRVVDAELTESLKEFSCTREKMYDIVEAYMMQEQVHSKTSKDETLNLLLEQYQLANSQSLITGRQRYPSFNEWYYYKKEPVFPSWIKDPIITCITCMASFHSLVLYTIVTACRDYYWNPLEWIAVAIPVAFTGEFLWFLKKKIQS